MKKYLKTFLIVLTLFISVSVITGCSTFDKSNSDIDDTENEVKEETNNGSAAGLRSDFKKSMDDYEKFMDEYFAFMKKYKESNGTDMSLLKDYASYLEKYSKMVSSFENWDNKDLNSAEIKYYLEVQSRVNSKLVDAAID